MPQLSEYVNRSYRLARDSTLISRAGVSANRLEGPLSEARGIPLPSSRHRRPGDNPADNRSGRMANPPSHSGLFAGLRRPAELPGAWTGDWAKATPARRLPDSDGPLHSPAKKPDRRLRHSRVPEQSLPMVDAEDCHRHRLRTRRFRVRRNLPPTPAMRLKPGEPAPVGRRCAGWLALSKPLWGRIDCAESG